MATFNVTPAMLESWAREGTDLPSEADIAAAESALGFALPDDYKAFIRQYGFVSFGRDDEDRCSFSMILGRPWAFLREEHSVGYLPSLDKLVQIHRSMTTTDDLDDETRPSIPPGFLPVARDARYGCVLIDVAEHPGRVWFWPESDWRWGTEDNRFLGYVADSFEAFINGLQPYRDRPRA